MKVYDRLDRQYQMYADEYKAAAIRALDSGWYILGKEVENFEQSYAEYMGSKYCVALNSGLDALTLSIRALGIGEGDEVIVQANTYIATVIGITENGAVPIFVEPDKYYNIDVGKIEERITDRTKAIMVVHLYGQASNMRKIKDIADKHNLYLIEDCAQSHGACFDGKITGTWGNVGCFSFYPTKNLGAFGDSGAIITEDKELADRMKKIRNYGSGKRYYNEIAGVNSRMDEIQAALLSVKLTHLKELTKQRGEYAAKYLKGINNPRIKLPETRQGAEHIYHLFIVQCEERDELQDFLLKNEISTQIHYPIPPHLQECYRSLGYKRGDFPITESYSEHIISLPFYNGMLDEEIEYVVETVNRF